MIKCYCGHYYDMKGDETRWCSRDTLHAVAECVGGRDMHDRLRTRLAESEAEFKRMHDLYLGSLDKAIAAEAERANLIEALRDLTAECTDDPQEDDWLYQRALDRANSLLAGEPTRAEVALERDRFRAERDDLLGALRGLIEATDADYVGVSSVGTGNGPHHGHERIGIWDESDQPCGYCEAWSRARAVLAKVAEEDDHVA